MIGLNSNDRRISTLILTLSGLPGIGNRTVGRILENHTCEIGESRILDEAFARSLHEGAIDRALGQDGVFWEDFEERADKIVERAQRADVSILHPFMDAYPKRLLFNRSFPPILYVKGDADALNAEKAVAVIGTREPTSTGEKWGKRLTRLLVEDGYAVVGGLAKGCDTIGHEAALDAGGITVAVLPTPVDAPVYPKQNQALADRILNHGGALVSEYAPGIEVYDKRFAGNLTARDEWQPGLSDGVIVIETSVDGGTNHAIRHALKTDTPVAMFDYSELGDPSIEYYVADLFSGNREYIESKKARPIKNAASIETFKKEMDAYRAKPHRAPWSKDKDVGDIRQMRLGLQ